MILLSPPGIWHSPCCQPLDCPGIVLNQAILGQVLFLFIYMYAPDYMLRVAEKKTIFRENVV